MTITELMSRPEISIKIKTSYIEDQSAPENRRFVFAYTITIHNDGEVPARLISRHWVITDATGKKQEVQGLGVVGEQPYLRPGEGFQYTSGTVLETPVGSMEGTYQMVTDGGDEFNAIIPAFTLHVPKALH